MAMIHMRLFLSGCFQPAERITLQAGIHQLGLLAHKAAKRRKIAIVRNRIPPKIYRHSSESSGFCKSILYLLQELNINDFLQIHQGISSLTIDSLLLL